MNWNIPREPAPTLLAALRYLLVEYEEVMICLVRCFGYRSTSMMSNRTEDSSSMQPSIMQCIFPNPLSPEDPVVATIPKESEP